MPTFDPQHVAKGTMPIPTPARKIDSDPTAAAIRAAIVTLASLLQGGTAITYRVGEAEFKAATSRKRTPHDLHALNWGNPATAAALGTVSDALRLARMGATGEVIDAARIARDQAFIATADAFHTDEGVCEVNSPDDATAPLYVSAADDLEGAGGAYVQAWVWVDLAAMRKTLATQKALA